MKLNFMYIYRDHDDQLIFMDYLPEKLIELLILINICLLNFFYQLIYKIMLPLIYYCIS